jgi:integrase
MTDSRAKTLTTPGLHRDRGDGAVSCLYLQVTPSTVEGAPPARSWIYRYKSPVHRRARQMGLGSTAYISLAHARDLARKHTLLTKVEKLDPIDERRRALAAAQMEAAKCVTFAQVAQQYLADRRPAGQNPKHARQVENSLTVETARINHLPIRDIDTQLVLSVLQPTWKKRTATMQRVRSRIESVLDYATVSGFRTGDNPARWKGSLEYVLPKGDKAETKHHAAMPVEDVPAFMAKLRANDSQTARLLEFLILTATRSKEGRCARWDEIDTTAKTWTIPAANIKARRDHCVPLSSRALKILAGLPRDSSPYVFLGSQPGKPLSAGALDSFDKAGFTTHGFRSTFKTWADSRGFADDISEAALAHKDGNKTRAAYKRSDRLEERRPLMDGWARFCTAPAGNVVPIRARTVTA